MFTDKYLKCHNKLTLATNNWRNINVLAILQKLFISIWPQFTTSSIATLFWINCVVNTFGADWRMYASYDVQTHRVRNDACVIQSNTSGADWRI